MSYPQLIPTQQKFGKIEPAFNTNSTSEDEIIHMAWGPISKVIGGCVYTRHGVGQCAGAFYSRDVDARDLPLNCIPEENRVADIGFNPYDHPAKPIVVPRNVQQLPVNRLKNHAFYSESKKTATVNNQISYPGSWDLSHHRNTNDRLPCDAYESYGSYGSPTLSQGYCSECSLGSRTSRIRQTL